MSRPLRALIDLSALRENYQRACALFPQSRAIAVLKANAYGHGALRCAKALEDIAPAFAVASIEEALALRAGGITQPIVLLEGFFEASELSEIARQGLWTALHSQWQVDALLEADLPAPVHAWLKFDSGMHRLGFSAAEFAANWRALAASGKVQDMHLITHFATADLDDHRYRDVQLEQIAALRGALQHEGHEVPCCLANSPATLTLQGAGNWHRPGLMLYGADPLEHGNTSSHALKPVMTLESELIAVRDVAAGEPVGYGGRFVAPRATRIGVVACGYGDGYDRHAGEGTPLLVDGVRAPLAGRVSMDMMTVDVSHIETARIGSRVTLWGSADGGASLSVSEVASWCDTINYTLLTGVMPRVPRIFIS
ncbi:alanine racemase [Carnimonas bestiolae]|uniref:alanine racemase n=1 Tax=Carnimonas bestiolae TaxID=3402172 RepID=UPI003EDC0D01